MLSRFLKNKRPGRRKNLFLYFFLILLMIAFIVFLVLTNIRIERRRSDLTKRIDSLKKEIEIMEKKNVELKADVLQKNSEEYLEEVARDDLNMKKPGEEVVVLKTENQKEEENGQKEIPPSGTKNHSFLYSWWQWLKSKF